MIKRYLISVTESRAQAISLSTEMMARFLMGQASIADYLRDNSGKSVGGWEIKKQVESIIKPAMGLRSNQSFGVGKFQQIDELFDLHEVVRKTLADDRADDEGKSQPERWGTQFDQPFHWDRSQPLAKIRYEDGNNG